MRLKEFNAIVLTLLAAASSVEEELLESERELKRVLAFVEPLMAILTNNSNNKGQSHVVHATGRQGGCCDYGTDYVGILSLIALGLLGFYLITVLATTTASGGRKKRNFQFTDPINDNNNVNNEIS